MPHIVFDVSGHGFGHLAQTGAVLRTLRTLRPDLRFTVRAEHAPATLREFLPVDVTVDRPPPDATLAMVSPTAVDVPVSIRRYQELHSRWRSTVEAEAARLAVLAPDLLVSDVGYVGLAAARRLDLPAYAMCSLDWYGVFRTYCDGCEGFADISAEIFAAYQGAAGFLQLAPHMSMDYFTTRIPFGPVARLGRNRRPALERDFPALAGRRLVLFSLGGIPGGTTATDLPRREDICWVCDVPPTGGDDGIVRLAELGIPFIDVVASADAVLTKPGYGMVVEAVCNGTAVVSVERPGWPENEPMRDWARQFGRAVFVPNSPQWIDAAVEAIIDLSVPPRPQPLVPNGAKQVGEFLAARIDP